MKRKKLGSSHAERFGYYLDESDLYVYQRNEQTGQWCGWFCSLATWETTFTRADWIAQSRAA